MRTTMLGVSLKTYFTHARTLEWMRSIAALLGRTDAVRDGLVEFFVAPTFPSLKDAVRILEPGAVAAQDVAATAPGAYTGEVSAEELAEIGVRFVEIGHAERRSLFGETDDVVRAKCVRALNVGLTPLLCVGEPEQQDPEATAEIVIAQAKDALLAGSEDRLDARVVLAYEPYWAIGAPHAAPAEYVQAVCRSVKAQLRHSLPNLVLLYGGSAGPGTLTALGPAVDGLFLGRFAHEVQNVEAILREVGTPT